MVSAPNVTEFFIIQFDHDVPNYKKFSLQEQRKARMNKLKTKEKQSLEGSLKHVILYIYIQKKLIRSGKTMYCETWIDISCKPLLVVLP
jgi:hypothetical protein